MTWPNKQELTARITRCDPCWSSYSLTRVSPTRVFWLQCQTIVSRMVLDLQLGRADGIIWSDLVNRSSLGLQAVPVCAYSSHLRHFSWLHKRGSRCGSPAVCLDAEELVLWNLSPPNCFPEIRQNMGSWLKVSLQIGKCTVLAIKKYLSKFCRNVAYFSACRGFASRVCF